MQELILFWLFLTLAIGCFVKSHAIINPCATTNLTDVLGESIVLGDGSMLENLLDSELVTQTNLNTSWTVGPACKLTYCTGVYMTNQCETARAGSVSISSSWTSVLCTCKTIRDCKTSVVSENACARLYIKPGNCSVGNSAYTEIPPGEQEAFADIWHNKIGTILVQEGCNLTIFDKEDFEGSSKIIAGSSIQNRTRRIASWKCSCDSRNLPITTKIDYQPTDDSVIQAVIPESLDDVVEQLAEHIWMHPGLLASLSGISNSLSSRNAYVIILGSSGAGKSSLINALLGQNVTTIGDYTSITSQIVEYRIPFPLTNLGIKNSELRIIDTPGLGDTGGIENDAAFLATLENYLTTHSELKSRNPNFVLILHSFNDNRFSDESSNFIRMVRALDTLRPLITHDKYPSVLFLFSHLCSVSPETQRNPLPLLTEFKQTVEKFTFFPKPILATVGENLGMHQNLPIRNGNTQLPNYELYPLNVLDKMNFISRRNRDKIGNAVVNSEELRYKMLHNVSFSRFEYPLVGSSHHSVTKYLKFIQMSALGASSTEISTLLTEAYKSMNPVLKSQFPDALEELQKLLYQQGIISKADIPNTLTTKLDLLSKTQHNLAMQYLLQNGLQFTPPPFPGKMLVGECYDIFKQSILPTQLFEITTNTKPTNIGFSLSNFIKCTELEPPQFPTNTLYILDTERQYFDHRLATYLDPYLASKANSSELFSSIVENVKPGYLVKSIKCRDLTTDNFCFTLVRKYNIFQLELDPEFALLQTEFSTTLNTLPEFYEHNYENVDQWTKFFREYGTHIITSAEGGGQLRIQFHISASTEDVQTEVNKVIKIIEYIENPQRYALENKQVYKWVVGNASGVKYTLAFQGGDQKYYVQDFSSSTLEQTSSEFSKWKKSLKYFPVVFSKDVVPIHEIVSKFVPVEKQAEVQSKIKIAFERLISGTLKYTEDPKIIAERERLKKEEEEKRKQEQLRLIEQMNKEQEALRLKLEEERQRVVAEAKALEEARKRQELELAARARERELQRQREREQQAALARKRELERQRQKEEQDKKMEAKLNCLRRMVPFLKFCCNKRYSNIWYCRKYQGSIACCNL